MFGRTRDQTIGPPWEYDELHSNVIGRKLSTGGQVSIAIVYANKDDDDKLYFPMEGQEHVIGYIIAQLLQDHEVHFKDWRMVGVKPNSIRLCDLVYLAPVARVKPSITWWQKLLRKTWRYNNAVERYLVDG